MDKKDARIYNKNSHHFFHIKTQVIKMLIYLAFGGLVVLAGFWIFLDGAIRIWFLWQGGVLKGRRRCVTVT